MNGVGLAGSVDAESADHASLAGLFFPGLAMFLAIVLHKPADALAISTVLSRKGTSRNKIFLVQLADAPRLGLDVLSWSRHFRCFPGQGDLPVTGWLPAFALHGLIVFGELLRSLSSGTTLTQIAGRLVAWFTLSDYRLHHHLLAVAREIVERETGERAVIVKLPRESVAVGASTELRAKRAG